MKDNLRNVSIKALKKMSTLEIESLSNDVRDFLIESNSQTGGHIGANLGTVELSLALHYAFNSPDDIIVWDTGHTGYTHKIITGRIDKFSTRLT